MPYKIVPVKNHKFKVCDAHECLSKKGLPKKTALKQRIAVILSEHKKNPKKKISDLFY